MVSDFLVVDFLPSGETGAKCSETAHRQLPDKFRAPNPAPELPSHGWPEHICSLASSLLRVNYIVSGRYMNIIFRTHHINIQCMSERDLRSPTLVFMDS